MPHNRELFLRNTCLDIEEPLPGAFFGLLVPGALPLVQEFLEIGLGSLPALSLFINLGNEANQ